jgi:hypothetical protein
VQPNATRWPDLTYSAVHANYAAQVTSPPIITNTVWTPAEKNLAHIAASWSMQFGAGVGAASLVCLPLPPPVQTLCLFAFALSGAGVAGANNLFDNFATIDPIDPNFTVIAQPVIPTLPLVVAQPGITTALATALNQLNSDSMRTIAYAQAAITSGNRAQGAANAGNAFWQAAQLQAEERYSSVLVSQIQSEPVLLANLRDAWMAGGYGTITVTPADALAYESALAQNGLPESLKQAMTQAGVDDATIAAFKNVVTSLDVNQVAGTFPDKLIDPSFVSAVQNFVNAFPVKITALTATPSVLWPPNHKMIPVSLSVISSDGSATAPSCSIATVSSNEFPTVPGENDWLVTGPLTLSLRAERSGGGDGRVYTIGVTCTNTSGVTATKLVTVVVPHDQSR